MTEDIATDSEVQEPENKEPIQSPHEKRLEEIAARRRKEEGMQDDNPEPDSKPDDEPDPTVKQDEMVELIGEDGSIIRVPKTAKYRGKVDGQDIEVSFNDMATGYQVRAASQRRLEQASLKQKELEAKERELSNKGKDLDAREQSFLDKMKDVEDQQKKGAISDDSRKKLAERLLKAFTESDNPLDDLEQVISELTPEQQAVDYDKIKSEATKEALAEIEKREEARAEDNRKKAAERRDQSRIEANQKFETEYADIIGDPIAYSAAKNLAGEKWAERPDADPWEIAQEVGNEIRTWVKAKTPPVKGREKPPVIPKSVSARSKVGEDKKPQTKQDVINEMKRQRGQPV